MLNIVLLISSALADPVSIDPAADRVASGAEIFATFCVACHGVDGTGPVGPNFIAEPQRLAKPDEELLAAIRDGVQSATAVMPPMGGVVDEQGRRDVLAYLRSAFAPAPSPGHHHSPDHHHSPAQDGAQ